MNEHYFYIAETTSTNVLMKEMLQSEALPNGFVVHAGFQSAGRGQGSNTWESAKDKNLLFSLLLRPQQIDAAEFFLVSRMVSLGILHVLRVQTDNENSKHFSIKWPNDIYWKNQKIGGILIENTLQGRSIQTSICGIGLNINQDIFTSDAPNPISLLQITGQTFEIKQLLQEVRSCILKICQFTPDDIRQKYMLHLYRNTGYHPFKTSNFTFYARVIQIESDGKLMLEDTEKQRLTFYFKEVEFIL